jgi:hypothetical protein
MDGIQIGDIAMSFDPRTIGKPVYTALSQLRNNHRDRDRLKEQKNQAVELYTYLSTWGLLRLKAEEKALSDGKKDVVKAFFACLGEIIDRPDLAETNGLEILTQLDTDDYLGLTGLGLALAQEFSFWANTVYFDIKGVD